MCDKTRKSFQFLKKQLPFVGCSCIETFDVMNGQIPTGQRMISSEAGRDGDPSPWTNTRVTPPKTNMTMEKWRNNHLKMYFPFKNGDFPLPCWISGSKQVGDVD